MRLTYTSPQAWKRQGFAPKRAATYTSGTYAGPAVATIDDDTDEADVIHDFRRASQSYRAHARSSRREE